MVRLIIGKEIITNIYKKKVIMLSLEEKKLRRREGAFRKIKDEYCGYPMSSKAEREWRQKIDEVYKFLNL